MTGAYKSTLVRHLFLPIPPPKLVVDPVGSMMTSVPGVVTFSDPARIPDRPVLRFVPADPEDLDAYGRLYEEIRKRVLGAWKSGDAARARMWIWCDEAGMVMPTNQTRPACRTVVIAGRKWAVGHAALHPRPRECHRSLPSQAQHVFTGALPLEEDRDYIARMASVPRPLLERAMLEAGENGMVHWDQRARTLTPLEIVPE